MKKEIRRINDGKMAEGVCGGIVIMPDGSVAEYKVPAIYVGHYTKDEILQKQLFFLLPFYIMWYEKKVLDTTHPELRKMLEEYREIEKCLEEEFLEEGKEKVYRDLIELIIWIAGYILKGQEETKKGKALLKYDYLIVGADSFFGGRLGNYEYHDMDQVIEFASEIAEKELA